MSSRSANEQAVLAALTAQPAHNWKIAQVTGLRIHTVNSIIGRLVERKEIESIGTLAELRQASQSRRSTKVYAVKGTPRLGTPAEPAIPSEVPDDIRIAQRITIPQYRYGSSRLV